jgi:WD40 repeat protein
MNKHLSIGAVAATICLGAGLLASPALASASPSSSDARAVFVQTDETSANHVVAYIQDSDGNLTRAHTYATGGRGGVLPTSVIDHTASQGSVTFDPKDSLLFVANAGSNNITVFTVDGPRLRRVQVIGSGGTFPVSVAVHDGQVFVANAQDGGTIQGYVVAGERLVRVASWNRGLGLDPTLTTFTQTPGQVAFSPKGNQLLVTTKANRNSIEVFNLKHSGAPAASPISTVLPGTAPFALAFDPAGDVLSTDASAAATVNTLNLHADGTLSLVSTVPTGQKGTCWVVTSGDDIFTTNPGGPSVSSLLYNSDGTPTVVGATPTDPGTVDAAVSHGGKFLYVQTGGNGFVDEFQIGKGGSLSSIGTIKVANALGAEGIAAI